MIVNKMSMEEILSRLASPSSRIALPKYEDVPDGGGVYCFWDNNTCLYVGMSSDELRDRLGDHISGNGNKKLGYHITQRNFHVKFSYRLLVDSGSDICLVESAAIDRFNPAYNERRPSCNT